jgi:hypothetical protein
MGDRVLGRWGDRGIGRFFNCGVRSAESEKRDRETKRSEDQGIRISEDQEGKIGRWGTGG